MGKKKKGEKSLEDERKLAKKLKKAAKQAAEERAPEPAAAEPTPGKKAKAEVAPPPSAAKAKGDRPAKSEATPAKPRKASRPAEAADAKASSAAPEPVAPREEVAPPKPVAPGNFAVSVPVVALKVADGTLQVAVSGKRLPAAALGTEEQLHSAAGRALALAGLSTRRFRLLPLATDLEGAATIAASWVALGRPGDDDATWLPVAEAPAPAAALVRTAVERLASLLETTTIGASLCATEFTVGELRETYAAVWGADPDGRNFHRKVTGVADFLIGTGERTSRSGGRPAMLYRAGQATQLNPAVTRVS